MAIYLKGDPEGLTAATRFLYDIPRLDEGEVYEVAANMQGLQIIKIKDPDLKEPSSTEARVSSTAYTSICRSALELIDQLEGFLDQFEKLIDETEDLSLEERQSNYYRCAEFCSRFCEDPVFERNIVDRVNRLARRILGTVEDREDSESKEGRSCR